LKGSLLIGGAGLEGLGNGPGFAIVAAEGDGDVAPGGVFAIGGVRVREKQERTWHAGRVHLEVRKSGRHDGVNPTLRMEPSGPKFLIS